jgi:hypothetical protein
VQIKNAHSPATSWSGFFICQSNLKSKPERKNMIVIEANYSKKLGLPGYSSHQYSVTLRAEIADLSQVSAKSQELHQLSQIV